MRESMPIDLPIIILTHAENALLPAKQAREVLTLWINSIPYGDERHSEACLVGVIHTLLSESISELKKAVDVFDIAQKKMNGMNVVLAHSRGDADA